MSLKIEDIVAVLKAESGNFSELNQDGECLLDLAAAEITRLRGEVEELTVRSEIAEALGHELGERDGYEDAVQDFDVMTGGDGEFIAVLGPDPDERHCPDAETMKARIQDRLTVKDTLLKGAREVLKMAATEPEFTCDDTKDGVTRADLLGEVATRARALLQRHGADQ